MARYQNGTLRPSQDESVSDQLRAVRNGYLMDGGVPVSGNYMDAISEQLRAGFGPPPTPTVGYAATAEYVYPSKKMVTGAALASADLRRELSKPSYSSPAEEYHRQLRALKGLGAGDGTSAADYGYTGDDAPSSVAAPGAIVSPLAIRIAGDFGLQAEIAQALVDGDADKARDNAAKLVAAYGADLAAYDSSNAGAQFQYVSCLRSEAGDYRIFGGFQPEKCSTIVSGPGAATGATSGGAPFDWNKLVGDVTGIVTALVGGATATPAQQATVDAAINRLRMSGQPVPAACNPPNQYTPQCAQAIAMAAQQQQQAASSNTALYIGLGVAAIIGIALFAMKKPSAA